MRSRWLTGRAIGFHLLMVVVASVCLLAGWWQLHQALAGNTLSWAYTVEWPIFAAIAVVAWWHLIHEDPEERAARAEKAARSAARQARDKPAAVGAGPRPERRTWREATTDAYEWDDVSEVDVDRVAAAARREYDAHVAGLVAREEGDTWRWRNARGVP